MRTGTVDHDYDSVVLANRQGVVGGTARAVALAYRKLSSRLPEAGIQETALVAFESRYALFRTAKTKRGMATLFHFLHEDEVRSLAHFVVLILTVEADFDDYTIDVQLPCIEAITSELLANGVPQHLVFGQDVLMAKSPERLFLMYQDTVARAVTLMNSEALQSEEGERQIDSLIDEIDHPPNSREDRSDGASLVGVAMFWSAVFLVLLFVVLAV